MINLIKKDIMISLTKWNTVTLIIIVLFYFFLMDEFPIENRMIFLITIIPFFVMQVSFSFDDRIKSIRMIRSLPVTAEDVIYSKYMGMVFIYSFLSLMLQAVLFLLSLSGVNASIISWNRLILSGIFIMLVTSISFPAYFKLSYNKSRIFNIILYCFIFSMLSTFFCGDMDMFYNFYRYVDRINIYLLLLMLVTLLIYFISSVISVNLYKTRDL